MWTLEIVKIIPDFPMMVDAALVGLFIALIGGVGYALIRYSIWKDRYEYRVKKFLDTTDVVAPQWYKPLDDEEMKLSRPDSSEKEKKALLIIGIVIVLLIIFLLIARVVYYSERM